MVIKIGSLNQHLDQDSGYVVKHYSIRHHYSICGYFFCIKLLHLSHYHILLFFYKMCWPNLKLIIKIGSLNQPLDQDSGYVVNITVLGIIILFMDNSYEVLSHFSHHQLNINRTGYNGQFKDFIRSLVIYQIG